LQKIDKKKPGGDRRACGHDEAPDPALRENEFDQKPDEEEGRQRKTQVIRNQVISKQGNKRGQNPLPGIGFGEK
jgi:hypothetical protein